MDPSGVTLALSVFTLFAAISAVGAFLVAARWWGRAAAIVAALLTLAFFAALLAGVRILLAGVSG